jgi:DnaJ-class molecular chaperone
MHYRLPGAALPLCCAMYERATTDAEAVTCAECRRYMRTLCPMCGGNGKVENQQSAEPAEEDCCDCYGTGKQPA